MNKTQCLINVISRCFPNFPNIQLKFKVSGRNGCYVGMGLILGMRICPPPGAGSSGHSDGPTKTGWPGAMDGTMHHGKCSLPPPRNVRPVLKSKMTTLWMRKECHQLVLPGCLARQGNLLCMNAINDLCPLGHLEESLGREWVFQHYNNSNVASQKTISSPTEVSQQTHQGNGDPQKVTTTSLKS